MNLAALARPVMFTFLIGSATACDYFSERESIIAEHDEQVQSLTLEKENTEDFNKQLIEDNESLMETQIRLETLLLQAQDKLIKLDCQIPDYDFKLFLRRTPEARKYFPYLLEAIERHRDTWPIDPMFALAILKKETEFGEYKVSSVGAMGDWQFMEYTWDDYGTKGNKHPQVDEYYSKFKLATKKRKDARVILNGALSKTKSGIKRYSSYPDSRETRQRLESIVGKQHKDFAKYFILYGEAQELEKEAMSLWRDYNEELKKNITEIEKEVKTEFGERHRYEDGLASSRTLPKRTKEQKEREIQIEIDRQVSVIDRRLTMIEGMDTFIRHLAKLGREFNGREDLMAARYNASENLLMSAGDWIIPRIPYHKETTPYVNKVLVNKVTLMQSAGLRGEELFPKNYCE